MEKTLKFILEATIKPTNKLLYDSFKLASKLILSQSGIFIRTPSDANIPISYFDELRKKLDPTINAEKKLVHSEDYSKFVHFFENEAIIIYDNTYASAFGQMKYIFRAKGIRVYLLKSGIIKVVAVYCTIDHNGFNLNLEEFDSFDISTMTEANVIQLFQYMDCKNIKESSVYLIRIISKIRKEFQYAYFLEYLLTPPDVDIISNFSTKIQVKLWNLCLSKEYENTIGRDNQNNFIKILTSLGISPTIKQYSSYLTQFSGNNEILAALKRIETNTNSKLIKFRFTTPFFEFQPITLIKKINNSTNSKFWRVVFIIAVIMIIIIIF